MAHVEKKIEMSLDDIIKANRAKQSKPKPKAVQGKAKQAAAAAMNTGKKAGGKAAKVQVTKPGVEGKRQAIKAKKAVKVAAAGTGVAAVKNAPKMLSVKGAGVLKGLKTAGGVKQTMARRIMAKAKGGAGGVKPASKVLNAQPSGKKMAPKQLAGGKPQSAGGKVQLGGKKQVQPGGKKMAQAQQQQQGHKAKRAPITFQPQQPSSHVAHGANGTRKNKGSAGHKQAQPHGQQGLGRVAHMKQRAPVSLALPSKAARRRAKKAGAGGAPTMSMAPPPPPAQGGVGKRRRGGNRAPVFTQPPVGRGSGGNHGQGPYYAPPPPPPQPRQSRQPPSQYRQPPPQQQPWSSQGRWRESPPRSREPEYDWDAPPAHTGVPHPSTYAPAVPPLDEDGRGRGPAVNKKIEYHMALQALRLQQLEDQLRKAERAEFIYKTNRAMDGNAHLRAGNVQPPPPGGYSDQLAARGYALDFNDEPPVRVSGAGTRGTQLRSAAVPPGYGGRGVF